MIRASFDGTYLETEATGQSRVGFEILRAARDLVGPGKIIDQLDIATFSGALRPEYAVQGYPLLKMGSSPRWSIYLGMLGLSNLAHRLVPKPNAAFWLTPERFGRDVDGMRQAVMVHDLASIRFPSLYPSRHRWLRHASLKRICNSACHVIAISQSTKQDVMEIGRIPADRITVIHNGVSDAFHPMPNEELLSVADRYALRGKRFIMFVGRPGPRKNVLTLLKAFKKARNAMGGDLSLAIIGPRGMELEALISQAGLTQGDRDAMILLGRIPDEDLVAVYNLAWVFVFPTLYEGFGLPVLESMACGTPVISSDCSSIPEIVQDAGILLPPTETDLWVDALCTLARNESTYRDLREKGIERASTFTWRRSAEKLLRILANRNDCSG